ncbi:unnamed protein product [Vicia faba]|uniref:HMA domain-containing protein n=1 Tax=Vicia faba TaxID=3906 RepID=A0AAV1AQQ1_VICFA|nr:unnamed protein product [Vicia faba]
MENTNDLPISTLKVNFGCTKGCSEDITNMLKQLKEVKSISIDPSQGNVTVVGNVNPMKLVKLLQKMGKKAQLWSFDKEPNNKKAGSHAKDKHHSCDRYESSDIEDVSQTDHGYKQRTTQHQKNKKMHGKHKHHSSDCHEISDTEDDVSQTDHGYKQRTTQHHKNNKAGSHVKHKHPSSGCHESSDTEDDSQTDHGHKHRTHQHQKNKKMHDNKRNHMFGFGNQHGPPRPPPQYTYQPFPGYHNNYHPAMHEYQPQHGAYAMPPSMYPGSRPPYPGPYHGSGQPWPSYGQYGSMFPSYNPMVHYNSYEDNYRYPI